MKPTRGILILAFGKRQYHQLAAHLAMSIAYHSPRLPITVLTDDPDRFPHTHRRFVDDVLPLPARVHLNASRRPDPGRAKTSLPELLPYDETLYLDADGLALSPLDHIFDHPAPFAACPQGEPTPITATTAGTMWASNEAVARHFELPDDATITGIQTSLMLFRKGPELDALSDTVKRYRHFPARDLSIRWGDATPDELIYTGAAAKLGIDPRLPTRPVFFPFKNSPLPLREIAARHSILALYGNGHTASASPLVRVKYRDWYDRLTHSISRHYGMKRLARANALLSGKFVN